MQEIEQKLSCFDRSMVGTVNSMTGVFFFVILINFKFENRDIWTALNVDDGFRIAKVEIYELIALIELLQDKPYAKTDSGWFLCFHTH